MEILNILSKASGLSPFILIAILFVFSLGFLLAVREFMFWYLRIHKVSDSLKDLNTEVKELRSEVANLKLYKQEHKIENPRKEKSEDRFNLSH